LEGIDLNCEILPVEEKLDNMDFLNRIQKQSPVVKIKVPTFKIKPNFLEDNNENEKI